MSAGDLIITTAVEKRSDTSKRPALRSKWKTSPGHLLIMMDLGTVSIDTPNNSLVTEAKRRLRVLGFIPDDNRAVLDAMAAAEVPA